MEQGAKKTLSKKTLLLLAALAFAAPPAVAEPSLTLESEAVLAREMTPGGEVAWLYVTRDLDRGLARMVRGHEETTADRAGETRLELSTALPEQSLWAAVDVASGAVLLTAPEGANVSERELALDGLGFGPLGEIDRLTVTGRRYETLVVRPGAGAWALSTGDGGAGDEDGEVNASLTLAIDRMTPLGTGPEPPKAFAPGDVLVLIDPDRLEVQTGVLGEMDFVRNEDGSEEGR